MSSHNLDVRSGSKKRKRSERVYRFKSFGENGYPVGFVASSFRENVKALLEYGHVETSLCNGATGLKSWSFHLQLHRNAPVHLVLFVVEEPIEASINRHCKQCQYIGWGQHMVCNKKYHFVLPSTDTMVAAACLINCKAAGGGNNSNCYDDIPAGKSSSMNLVELEGHIMHGVFHSNGFGHLLCVNGTETTGSNLPGHQILDFWDRLCTGLRARKVSLKDVSQKRGMEMRLVHGLAYGEPWFGRWGYKFGRGTYFVTQQMYQSAIEALQGMPFGLLIHHLATITCNQLGHDISLIFSRYHTLSDHSLVTLSDLFHFMLELKSRLPTDDQNCIDSYNPGMLVETSCRWSPKRVEMASRVIVEALKRAHFRWVSRQEVRDAARAYIGDTGLLDFVLKSLGNQIVGNYLVRRSLNPVTKVLEYCLEDLSNVSPNQDGNAMMTNSKVKGWYKISRFQLMKDMFYLYKYILKDQKLNTTTNTGILSAIPMAVRIILDSKFLVKDYRGDLPHVKLELGPEGKSNLYCTVMLRNHSTHVLDHHNKMINNNIEMSLPPYECVTLKNNATIDDLKLEVERNFKEIYWGLKSFVVETIANLSIVAKGTDMIFGLVEVGGKIVLEGSNKGMRGGGGVGLVEGPIFECGTGNCIVDCPCGAEDDDGERMVCCDICEVWQHTLCVRIPNNEQVPHIFLCNRCEREIILLPSP